MFTAILKPIIKGSYILTTIDLFKNEKDFTVIPAGEVIFRQGEVPNRMYVILEGEVEISLVS